MDNLTSLQEKYQLTSAENESVFRGYILPMLKITDSVGQWKPKAMIIGGQPGSGKSSLLNLFKNQPIGHKLPIGVASDDYRHFHPKYGKLLERYPEFASMIVTPDADTWTAKVLAECMSRKMDIVLEGTMGKVSWAMDKQQRLKTNGYDIAYKVMAVNPKLSKLSTLIRYTEMKRSGAIPRFVTPDAHDERFNGLQHTVEILAKQHSANISLYTREIRHNTNGSFTDSLKPLEKISADPLADFKRKTSEPLSLMESDYIRKSIAILEQNGIPETLLKQAFPGFIEKESKKIKF